MKLHNSQIRQPAVAEPDGGAVRSASLQPPSEQAPVPHHPGSQLREMCEEELQSIIVDHTRLLESLHRFGERHLHAELGVKSPFLDVRLQVPQTCPTETVQESRVESKPLATPQPSAEGGGRGEGGDEMKSCLLDGEATTLTDLATELTEIPSPGARLKTRLQTEFQITSFELRMEWHKLTDCRDSFLSSLTHPADAGDQMLAQRTSKEQSFSAPNASKDPNRERCIMHPSSSKRAWWILGSLIALSYDVFMIPLGAFEMLNEDILLPFDWAFAIWWTVDVLVTLRTGYFVGTQVERRAFFIFATYAKTWLALDLLIVVTEWMAIVAHTQTGFTSILRSSRVFRAFRILRLVRVRRIPTLTQFVENTLHSSTGKILFSIIRITFLLLVILHAVSCGWYLLGNTADGWVSYCGQSIQVEAQTVHLDQEVRNPYGNDLLFWYFASARWTLAQVNGRTDLDDRRTPRELLYTCFVSIGFATVFMSIYISAITTTMMEFSKCTEGVTRRKNLLNRYVEHYEMSDSILAGLRQRMDEITVDENEQQKEEDLLNLLPMNLKNDLLVQVRSPTLAENRFMRSFRDEHPRVFQHFCLRAVGMEWFHMDEVIFDWGDACRRTLCIERGEMMYTHHTKECKKTTRMTRRTVLDVRLDCLKRRTCVSEAALWVEWKNQGTLKACSQSCALRVEYTDFVNLAREYHEVVIQAITYASAFIEGLNDPMDPMSELSDISVARKAT